ncbi:MAG: ABC transporter permease [Wenzhouxiangella sp.]|jgi:putative ABC transport system permease protein|nr:ABC transporter permease [Wenzhouxiangella sp.]
MKERESAARGIQLSASLIIALKAIRTNAVRSTLTMLGIIIGIGAAIVSVSISQGAGQQLQEQIESFGTHVLQVRPGSGFFGGRRQGAGTARPLTDRDVEAIAALSDQVEAVSGRVQSAATLVVAGRNWPTTIQGVGADFAITQDRGIADGRNFTRAEARRGATVALIGQTVVNELFNGGDPIGARIRINRTPVTVIGVLEEIGASNFGQDQDDIVWMPLAAVRSRISRDSGSVPDNAGAITIKVWSDLDVLAVEREIEDLLRLRRDIKPGADDDFVVFNFAEFIRARNETEALLGFLLAAFSATSLVVGGIGIMNIMLVSVTERTREIGLRLAVGARQRDVLTQFLVEATVLGLIGGVVGMLVGVAGTYLAAAMGEFPILISPWTLGGAVGIAILIAVFFGYYPARRASRLNPIDALRFE